jgi:hypothetical protein
MKKTMSKRFRYPLPSCWGGTSDLSWLLSSRDPQINCASSRACKNLAKGSALGSIRRKSRYPKLRLRPRKLVFHDRQTWAVDVYFRFVHFKLQNHIQSIVFYSSICARYFWHRYTHWDIWFLNESILNRVLSPSDSILI